MFIADVRIKFVFPNVAGARLCLLSQECPAIFYLRGLKFKKSVITDYEVLRVIVFMIFILYLPAFSCLFWGDFYCIVFRQSLWGCTECNMFYFFEGYCLVSAFSDVFYLEYSFVNPVFYIQVFFFFSFLY